MGFAEVAFFLMAVQALLLVQLSSRVSGDVLSPLLSPVLNGLCNAVDCGKGICKVSQNHSFGFVCQCNPGWNQFHDEDHFRFLPCVVPDCSINSSCSKYSEALAPSPFPPPPDNLSLFSPCLWSFCGGGECFQTSAFEHWCKCKQGYINLLNASSFPCFQDCSIGSDCQRLGITLSNSSSSPSSSPNLADYGNSSSSGSCLKNLLWLFMLMMYLVMNVDAS